MKLKDFIGDRSLLAPFVAKLTSGRFLFTVISAGVFAYMSINGMLPQDKVMEILLIVVYAYFNKPSTQNSNGEEGEEGDTTTTTTTKI